MRRKFTRLTANEVFAFEKFISFLRLVALWLRYEHWNLSYVAVFTPQQLIVEFRFAGFIRGFL